jgi:hypothetical protein
MLFTLVLMVLIVIGCFVKTIADNLCKMETFIIGIYGISFGVWKGSQFLNKKYGQCDEEPSRKEEIPIEDLKR